MPRFSSAARRRGIDGGGNVGEDALGGGLVVDGADGRIGFLVDGAEARDDGFQRRLGGDGKFLGEFGKSEGKIHGAFAFSLLPYHESAMEDKAAASWKRLAAANELVALQGGGDLEIRFGLIRAGIQRARRAAPCRCSAD